MKLVILLLKSALRNNGVFTHGHFSMSFFVRGLLLGMNAAFSFPVALLYRYPYFFPMEALKGDSVRIEEDVAFLLFSDEHYHGF
jgi:hypothetical protein